MTASNELLNNWSSANNVITTMLREAMVAQEDTDFLSGNGVNKSLGILNAPAAISFNRATANQIGYDDVIGMFARMMFGGTFAWIASQTIIPQLANIRDTGNNNLWMQSAVTGMPNTLAGIPLIYNERSPALGSRGDLMLVDLAKYLIKDGSGPSIAVSEHFKFDSDEVAFRLTWRVDGQSWLTAPVLLEEGTAGNTVSPFVILDIPG
jgi:HK97 family phage major capsid protein